MGSSPTTTENLSTTIERLARHAPSAHPVVSCFVNTGPDGTNRTTFQPWLKKAFADRVRSFPEDSEARARLERDRDRIVEHLTGALDTSTRAVALYASEGDGLFESHEFRAEFDDNRLVVGPVPHLYPLVKLADQQPIYAVCIAHADHARIVVCGLGDVLEDDDFLGTEPVDRTRVAGWAEVRYQGRIDDHIAKNAKEIVERLEKVVARGEVHYAILAGNESILAELRARLGPATREKLIDESRMPIDVEAHEVLRRTIDAVREAEAVDSRRLADALIDRFRAGGLAVAGLDPTIEALNMENVDRLLLSESFDGETGWQCAECRVLGRDPAPSACPFCSAPLPESIDLRDALVRRAERCGRWVEIVEGPHALAEFDGVGALLRYRPERGALPY